MLGLVMLGWIGMRAATWEAPFPAHVMIAQLINTTAADAPSAQDTPPAGFPRLQSPLRAGEGGEALDWAPPAVPDAPAASGWNDPDRAAQPWDGEQLSDTSQVLLRNTPQNAAHKAPQRIVAGHTMLLAAAFSQLEVPEHLRVFFDPVQDRVPGRSGDTGLASVAAAAPQAAPFAVPYAGAQQDGEGRWSADGWLMWRQDSASPLLSGRPSYGRSQAGAVVRYSLAPASRNRPQVYVRGSGALEGAREHEAAAGVSARPIAAVPIRLAAEMRLARRAGGTDVRPAAYAVTELPPVELPAGLTGELYLQGGYVGGDFATAFVDGQARVDRALAGSQDVQLRAGGAVWGGAQDDARRLDIGPSASVTFRLGDTRGRVAADYRFRVAGDAQPASGPALTLSAGF
ncbi:hypothetical protein GCM10009127_27590 [Alteraurantiacibacter aestuarii]